MNMDKRTQKALMNRLEKKNISYTIKQSEYGDRPIQLFISGSMVTDINYNCELDYSYLGDVIRWLDTKGYYFECVTPYNFAITLEFK